MTGEQFDLIARLMRARGLSRLGCRMVLVDHLRQCDVARVLDVDPALIAVSLAKYREIHAAILAAFT